MGAKMKLRVNVNEARRAEQRQQAEARRDQERTLEVRLAICRYMVSMSLSR